ncbi:MAG: hypothetical protein H6Q41_3482 [Deltaproteobacteria bacterium]|nr:hypothetical protein [Deltaproteobacteria bacterium]
MKSSKLISLRDKEIFGMIAFNLIQYDHCRKEMSVLKKIIFS